MAKKIVVVEDDPTVADMVQDVLKASGYDVSVCTEGGRALQTIEKVKPDLILLDLMLPGMDGHTIQAKMAEDDEKKNIPVIIVTALETSKAMFRKFRQVVAFLPKPFELNDLREKVHNALDHNTSTSNP